MYVEIIQCCIKLQICIEACKSARRLRKFNRNANYAILIDLKYSN